jgi:N-methylhydantoinase B/oxoprolinase/acetone carboxylase alpha subunit
VADNYNVKDAAGTTIAINSAEVSAGVHSPKVTPLVAMNAGAASATTIRVAVATDANVVVPAMGSAGHLSLQTAATGTNWTAFTSQVCKQLTISNQTGTTIEVRQGATGVGFQIPTGSFYTFFGLTNANGLDARRVDTSNTQVTVTARWES